MNRKIEGIINLNLGFTIMLISFIIYYFTTKPYLGFSNLIMNEFTLLIMFISGLIFAGSLVSNISMLFFILQGNYKSDLIIEKIEYQVPKEIIIRKMIPKNKKGNKSYTQTIAESSKEIITIT